MEIALRILSCVIISLRDKKKTGTSKGWGNMRVALPQDGNRPPPITA
jgi:hypothetical protein